MLMHDTRWLFPTCMYDAICALKIPPCVAALQALPPPPFSLGRLFDARCGQRPGWLAAAAHVWRYASPGKWHASLYSWHRACWLAANDTTREWCGACCPQAAAAWRVRVAEAFYERPLISACFLFCICRCGTSSRTGVRVTVCGSCSGGMACWRSSQS